MILQLHTTTCGCILLVSGIRNAFFHMIYGLFAGLVVYETTIVNVKRNRYTYNLISQTIQNICSINEIRIGGFTILLHN